MPSPIVALDLIKSSMRLAGIISGNQTPKANESNDALTTLNDLLEEWSTDSLTVWGSDNTAFLLTPGKAKYTIGPGGDFNDVRPVDINSAYIDYTTGGPSTTVSYPVWPWGQDKYNAVAVKATPGIPERLLYINNYPLGSVTLYPVPDQAYSIILVSDPLLNQVASLATLLSFPVGYAKALKWNLAVDLCAEFGMPVSPDVAKIAMSSLASIKSSNNSSMDTASFDSVLTDKRQSDGWLGGDF